MPSRNGISALGTRGQMAPRHSPSPRLSGDGFRGHDGEAHGTLLCQLCRSLAGQSGMGRLGGL